MDTVQTIRLPASLGRRCFGESRLILLSQKRHLPRVMDVQSLLNPASGSDPRSQNSVSQRPPPATQHYLVSNVNPRRPKLVKDAPVFSEGNKIVGHINYPPHEAGNDHNLEARHREFRVFPLGQILKKGMRHIPYGVEKKTDFGNKTGRRAFEG